MARSGRLLRPDLSRPGPGRLRERWVIGIGLVSGCIDFSIRGRDSVVADPLVMVETFQQEAAPKADVLWIVDDTGSMSEEQEALAAAFSPFVAALDAAGLAWQLGVITTAGSGEGAGELRGDPWIITPDAADPTAAFAAAAAVGTEGLGPSAGLDALSLALSEPLRAGANRGFRRPDAALQVVVVSDGDDAGVTGVEAVTELLQAETELTGLPSLLSAVVGDLPSGCSGPGGKALPAERYTAAALANGGAVASICDTDLGALLASLSAFSLVYGREFELQALPAGGVRVSVDGERIDEGWTIEDAPPRLVFDEAPSAGATIEVRYTLEEES